MAAPQPGRLLCRVSALMLCLQLHSVSAQTPVIHNTVDNYLQSNRAAGNTPNSLIRQNSPYLLQHAYNPVQWYAWGEQAFELAKQQNKPIFLSIGYSTCYWCHVMAHESFENEKIAAILNRHFISIKLDREQRPDVDAVYMAATELVNGYGGWPMTLFLNHKLEPFHAGVYYPPVSTDGSTGLTELLLRVNALWQQDRARIDSVAAQISTKIKAAADDDTAAAEINKDVLRQGMEQISLSYDDEYAGFGVAPKFPRPGIFNFLLKAAAAKGEHSDTALQMLRATLLAMSQGGIYDHVGGGFHRYSVDERWQVPHFEKMLYTQALMSLAYTRLYALAPDERLRAVVTATLDFVLAEMQHPGGVFYAALDASSERADNKGVSAEGAYYLWRAAELESLLPQAGWQLLEKYFDIHEQGNIESDPRGEFERLNILSASEEYRHARPSAEESALFDKAVDVLYQARLHRPRPHLDDKVISAWNGIMITALVEAAQVFDSKKYLDAAVRAALFMQKNLVDEDTHRLFRSMRKGDTGAAATLDDYVWFINGLLSLYQHTGDRRWLQQALQLNSWQQQHFKSTDSGSYFESGADRHLLFRSRTAYDGALPAANAIAVENLYRLADITGDQGWRQSAQAVLAAFADTINSKPAAAAWMASMVIAEQGAVKAEKPAD